MAREARSVEVWADWEGLPGATRMGTLRDEASGRGGREVFSFEYNNDWLADPQSRRLDPALALMRGRQFLPDKRTNFGIFLDSSPDRWGRVLMERKEAQLAREQGRRGRTLLELDYLLGVYDGHRMGALRFRVDGGDYLDDDRHFASPPWAMLRELEEASLALEREGAERDPNYNKWLRMLLAPGRSLGGARPKASVVGEKGGLWIAKFPGAQDRHDVGGWESVIHTLAGRAGLVTAESTCRRFSSKHHTFMTRRFDRTDAGARIHFASAMTLLEYSDGEAGASYLDLAGFLIQQGAQTEKDLEQLWRRIVFFVCVSNTDDHLRNHGFMLSPSGWALAPAYDVNPVPEGGGLALNISEEDNAQDLELVLEVSRSFRVKAPRARDIVAEVQAAVRGWREVAQGLGLARAEQDRMADAFALADSP